MDLKESFEIESGQGIYSNEGKEPLNNNGSYNDDYVKWLEAKINFTGCCELLKGKKELTFDEWCNINKYRKTKNGKYVDTQDLWFTEKALLKIYNLD